MYGIIGDVYHQVHFKEVFTKGPIPGRNAVDFEIVINQGSFS